MRKLRVAVDFDGVLALTVEEVGRILGDPVKYDEITDYNHVYDRWGKRFSETIPLAHASISLNAVPGAIEALEELAPLTDLYILTANKPASKPAIKAFLSRNGIDGLPIITVATFEDKLGGDYDVLIDDHPKAVGANIIQYSRPYNGASEENVWPFITEKVKNLIRMGV